tara:strand:- start:799 stop:1650 length:852 start_codon:yes stop_codon:yes gene_type:complete
MRHAKYDQLPLKINDINILATNLTISQESFQEPVYSLGRSGIHSQSPTASRAYKLSFSYVPVFQIIDYNKGEGDFLTHFVKQIKENKQSDFGFFDFNFSGLTSNKAALESLSFSISPYSIIEFSVSFIVFGEITGSITPELIPEEKSSLFERSPNSIRSPDMNNYTKLVSSPNSSSQESEGSVLESLNYSFSLTYEPVYKVGQEFPVKVLYQKAVEDISIAETFRETQIQYRDNDSFFDINLHTLESDYYLNLKMKNPMILSESSMVSSNELLSSSKKLRSHY